MPAKGTKKLTESTKRRVIAAKAAGLTDAAAAAAAGVGRTTIHKVLRDPGTRNLMREIKAAFADELAELWGLCIKSLRDDIVSAHNEGTRARLRDEVQRLMAFAEMPVGGGVVVGDSAQQGATLGQILASVSVSMPSAAKE